MKKTRSIEIIPTYVPSDEGDLARGAKQISEFADSIHVDVDDGAFAPVVTWPYTAKGVVGDFDLKSLGDLRTEVHLMIEEPGEVGMLFARAGAVRIVGHIEGFSNTTEAHAALDLWRRNGAEAGLGILLGTPFEVLEPLIKACDVVHMMSIATIGTQGITYESEAPTRIAAFHAKYPDMLISVDGGVAESNIAELARAGARRFGVGSAISKAPNPASAYAKIKVLAESAIL